MKVVVIPNSLRDAIHAKIDEKLSGRPIADADRETLYSELLEYFDKHGVVPDFEIAKRE